MLSKEFISKDDFLTEISIPSHHFEMGGNDDQLWLIDDESDACIIQIDLMMKDEYGNVIVDEFDDELYEGTNAPYKGLLYSIEYRDKEILKTFLSQLDKKDRNLYVEYDASEKFETI